MRTSLALYMTGMLASPAVLAIIDDFNPSLALAVAILAVASIHLSIISLPHNTSSIKRTATPIAILADRSVTILAGVRLTLYFREQTQELPNGVALLCYNAGVSYLASTAGLLIAPFQLHPGAKRAGRLYGMRITCNFPSIQDIPRALHSSLGGAYSR